MRLKERLPGIENLESFRVSAADRRLPSIIQRLRNGHQIERELERVQERALERTQASHQTNAARCGFQ